ncbi:hypothetical protein BV898_16208 [Hypsibius exemplaris]|uniref:Uncharacterized protein n=1 Tax=Hypsibius exemplaris TaxID=2072580 RepID=A0A9X6NCT2_HYPEX|nr:hypothetical protein BV898_16208 [Hypsibius exemplaris]
MYAALLNAVQENKYSTAPDGRKASDAAFLLTSLDDHQFNRLFRDAWMKVEKDRSDNVEAVDGPRCSTGQLNASNSSKLARVERVSKRRRTN